MVTVPIVQTFSHFYILKNDQDAVGIPLTTGVCIPKVCDPEYFKKILDNFGATIGLSMQDYDQTLNCNNGVVPDFTSTDIGAISLLSILGALIVVSTIYDILTLESDHRISILLAFSFYTNLFKLFETTPSNRANKNIIDCLNGIRCLSMMWIIMAHRFANILSGPTINLIYLFQWIKQYPSMLILSGTMSVDTFFLLSGFLVTHSILKELDQKRCMNVPYKYLHRYLRLTPSLAMLIFYHMTLFKYSGSGPFWKVGVNAIQETCKTNWWINLLYFQNYYRTADPCMAHCWYLAVDMQLYLLSPFLVWPLWKYGRKFLPVLIALLGLWLATLFSYFASGKYHMSFFANDDRLLRTYTETHTRYGPWLIGLLLAYFLHCHRRKEVTLHWNFIILGWILSLGIFASVIFGMQPLAQLDYLQHSQWDDSMYGTFSILAWSLGLSWVIWASINGYGGIINSFLSWTFWQPLGRLTYSMYLLHFPLQFTKRFDTKVHQNFSNIDIAYMFWGDLGFTLTVAIVWTLAFESPIVIIEKYCFGNKKQKIIVVNKNGTVKNVIA